MSTNKSNKKRALKNKNQENGIWTSGSGRRPFLYARCLYCGGEFPPRGNKKYCTSRCYQAHAKEKHIRTSLWKPNIASATVGAGHELLVCLDLMRKGYNIFRAESPSCPCDVILLDGEGKKTYRIEVRTCDKKNDGSISFSKASSEQKDYFDIFAAVTHDGNIQYFDNKLIHYDIENLK